jgi:tricarballylate dehydrogenase
MARDNCDVLVIGAGNAALCAAIAARRAGADVVVLERAPQDQRGGNSAFTAGAMRVAYDGIDDLRRLMPDLSDAEIARTDFDTYPRSRFFDDMGRITDYRTDPDLCELLVTRSLDTLLWMREEGVRFVPIYGRQAYEVNGRFTFWGGLTVEVSGGGPGLIASLHDIAAEAGVRVIYRAHARALLADDDGVQGARVTIEGVTRSIAARSVVLACGGFEANAEWRARYLGPHWDLAKVRGSRFNTGDGLRMALEVGASPAGNWSGCHAVGWDRNAPEFGDLAVGDGFQKHSYPLGIMVNARGERFVDEGADFRNFTYAEYGRAILEQPGHFAWQIFDAKVEPLLRGEYRIREITRVSANSLEELATKLEGVDPAGFLATVDAFNTAVTRDVPFDPNVKDGRSARGLRVAKSNWANPLDAPPYQGFAVTCGITFTFGGLRIDSEARTIDAAGQPIAGLYAAGELVGGLFYGNYPGGSGLTSGAVFGRIAGSAAAEHAAGA